MVIYKLYNSKNIVICRVFHFTTRQKTTKDDKRQFIRT